MKTFAPKPNRPASFVPPSVRLFSPRRSTLADLTKPLVQPKFVVGQQGNQYEQEADRWTAEEIGSNAGRAQVSLRAGMPTVGGKKGYTLSKTTNASPTAYRGHDFSKIRVSAAPMQVQTKLTVNEPGDKYEQEADRVAEEVMRVPDFFGGAISAGGTPTVQKKCAACANGGLCPKCMEEEKKVRRKPISSVITPLVQRQTVSPAEDQRQEEFCKSNVAQTMLFQKHSNDLSG